MRHRKKIAKLNKKPKHRRGMLRNLATSVILYDKIQTTEAKAKAIRPTIEKLIMLTKKKDRVHAIRQANRILFHKNASKKLFEELAKRYTKRNSGFTRIIPIKLRSGDNARIVQLSLL